MLEKAITWISNHKLIALIIALCSIATLSLIVIVTDLHFRNMAAAVPPANPKINYRLPNKINIHKYDIQLNPNLTEGTFAGSLKIVFTALGDNETRLVLHAARDMCIENVKLEANDTKTVIAESKDTFPVVKNTVLGTDDREFFTIELNNPLVKNCTYVLNIQKFTGSLTKKIVGLYQSTYVNKHGDKR